MQTAYNFRTPFGIPGGIYDLNAYISDSRRNEENDGAMKFGMGVVIGTEAGKDVKLPTSSSTIYDFEGVVQNGMTTEHNMNGDVVIIKKETVGVIRSGRIWARIGEDAAPAYGKPVYLIVDGEEAGMFTDEEDESTKIPVNARFLGGKGSFDAAPIEVWPISPAGCTPQMSIGDLSDVDIDDIADGQVLKYSASTEAFAPGDDETT